MTDRIEALKALLGKVESGCIDAQEYAAVFPNDGYHESIVWLDAVKAAQGSLDAAKAFHEAVLPGWHWSVYDTDGLGSSNVQVEPPEYSWEPYSAIADNPARAWLIAILKALIAQEDA